MMDGDRNRGSRPEEDLTDLLESVQGRVYSRCLKILHNPQDAEDATQEVLLEVAGAVRSARGMDDLERWLGTVAVHTALDLRKKRARRLRHERAQPGSGAFVEGPSGARDRLRDALSALEPESRRLLLRSLLDRCPLGELARESRCSTATVWRRIERWKAQLRAAVKGSWSPGLALGERLRKGWPWTTPSVGSSAPHPCMAGSAAGFRAVGLRGGVATGKGMSAVGVLAAGALFILLGGGARLWINTLRERGALRREEVGKRTLAATGPSAGPRAPASPARVQSARSREPAPGAAAPAGASIETLTERLIRFCTEVRAGQKLSSDRQVAAKLRLEQDALALRSDVRAHPSEYLAFLRSPTVEDVLQPLLSIPFCEYPWDAGKDGADQTSPSDPLLGKIQEVLLEFLETGTNRQKWAALLTLPDRDAAGMPPLAFLHRCLDLLATDTSPTVLSLALVRVEGGAPDLLPGRLDIIARLLEISRTNEVWTNPEDRGTPTVLFVRCLRLLSSSGTEASNHLLLEAFKEAVANRHSERIRLFAQEKFYPRLNPSDEGPVASLLSRSFANTTDPAVFRSLLNLCSALPPEKADAVMGTALGLAPTPEIRIGIQAAQERIRVGDRSTPRVLQDAGLPTNP